MCLREVLNDHIPVTGTDGPQPEETIGFNLNHLCIRIRDPEVSLKFYRDVLGLRRIFTVDGNAYTVYYLGYPKDAGKHQSGEELLNERLHRSGLLELIHVHGSENDNWPAYTQDHPYRRGFCHIGITVPDMHAAMARMKEHNGGVELEPRFAEPVRRIAFVEDPDGYWIELVPNHSDAALRKQ
ncbi:Glyoxalase/Bleomycin resistance protein/Dihydroxybiphenyl dioxygenase [Saitoella complicata NRRL Y-17804]|uniref:Glyoxalase/Bleomycin resistance protein/Dihydroxybiphenyl dioxygenase n=1 Tax=Saitoella complicata (strain BCRC 22490 / CBS 7301 / JCM 7358 / NBRC 10748 / NRRL Y-17804) TaxID=698492 RepID=UPI000866CBE8|nr:Glyoxalase/Bleomycin resistance protein/Dihydroxybiphenyl dioxygenase [Saitoella complicata NRRL Y-17804]ODQ50172.1 Glyoxalase/Bleomycin resistance protein/Dihydroxybiphenyl dioxygenase [Saitoella complicata NRRL Y-17804]